MGKEIFNFKKKRCQGKKERQGRKKKKRLTWLWTNGQEHIYKTQLTKTASSPVANPCFYVMTLSHNMSATPTHTHKHMKPSEQPDESLILQQQETKGQTAAKKKDEVPKKKRQNKREKEETYRHA